MAENVLNTCPLHEEHERRITCAEKNIIKINDKLVDVDKTYSITIENMSQTLKHLEKLPVTLDAIKEAMVTMQMSIKTGNDKTDNLTERVDGLAGKIEVVDKKVESIDKEGMFNIRLFISKNWASILLFIGGALALWKS